MKYRGTEGLKVALLVYDGSTFTSLKAYTFVADQCINDVGPYTTFKDCDFLMFQIKGIGGEERFSFNAVVHYEF